MYQSLIYVSRSLIRPEDRTKEIDHIVGRAAEHNARLHVRGALIFTERHFAQAIEGPAASLDELMSRIAVDPRHENVTVIERKPIDGYRFPDWNLAYWGDATYMDQRIERLMAKAQALGAVGPIGDFYELIRLLARESHERRGPLGRPSPA